MINIFKKKEFNKLIADNFALRLAQTNLAIKADLLIY